MKCKNCGHEIKEYTFAFPSGGGEMSRWLHKGRRISCKECLDEHCGFPEPEVK